MKTTQKLDLKSVVWKEGEQYVAQCLDVDVASFGQTREEALRMLGEALELYFEDIPAPGTSMISEPLLASVAIQLQHA